jgi:Na+/proline symporter
MASHGTDQLIVQRVLTTRSLQSARKALIGSGIVIVFQFALFLGVGVLLFDHYGGATPAALGLTRADEIFPWFIVEGLPPGLSGFIIAGLLAAAISTLAGSISSMSSSTVLDLIGVKVDSAGQTRTLRLSRFITVVWAGLLVVSAVVFMRSSQAVVELALSIASFTYGGLLGTFLLGVLFKRPVQEDALAGFVAGIFIMITVIALQLVAWTWFTAVGVGATLVVGSILAGLGRKEEGAG